MLRGQLLNAKSQPPPSLSISARRDWPKLADWLLQETSIAPGRGSLTIVTSPTDRPDYHVRDLHPDVQLEELRLEMAS